MPQAVVRDVLRAISSNVQATQSTSAKQARSESNLVINPLNSNHLVGASKKFIEPEQYRFTLAAIVSLDGGASWQEAQPFTLLPDWDGISDPALAWDEEGNIYLVALPFPPPTDPRDTLGIAVYKSGDGGLTWGDPKVIHSSTGDDKQWATSDLNASSPYYGRVYAAWDDGSVLRFARTSDHGQTWRGVGQTPINQTSLATDSFSPEISVAPNGHVFIVYWNRSTPGTKQLKFLKSTDGGKTFSAPQVVATPITDLESVFPKTGGWSQFPGSTFRVLTVATGCAGANGEILVAWADAREQYEGKRVSRIYYRRSPDGGTTWDGSPSGQPLLSPTVDATVTNSLTQDFHPQIIGAPLESSPNLLSGMSGAIACAFYRLSPHQGKNLIDVVLAASLDGGRTFTLKTIVTEEPWDPAVGAPWSHGDKNVTFIGEYFGFDASSSCFAPLWTDTRTGMQELFFSCLTIEKTYDIIGGEIGGEVIGGVKEDGGGWILLPGGHPIPIGPWDPLIDVLPALGAYRLAHTIRDSTLRAKLQVAAIETVGEIAHQLSQKR